MTDKILENKLVAFYSHYKNLANLLSFFGTTLLLDDTDEIPRAQIDVIVETLLKETEGKTEELKSIIDQYQATYCK